MNTVTSPLLNDVKHGFFGREGGVSDPPFESLNVKLGLGDDQSAVFENRVRAYSHMGAAQFPVIFANDLAHGNAVFVAREASSRDVQGYDAIVTNVPKLVIGLSTADCLAVLLYDSARQSIGVVHAGWRGLVAGVLQNTIDVMKNEYGAETGAVRAAVGPCICAQHYEVGVEVANRFTSQFLTNSCADGERAHLDLRSVIHSQLRDAGVVSIAHDSRCTFEDESLFSYRRDKLTGRQLAAICLP